MPEKLGKSFSFSMLETKAQELRDKLKAPKRGDDQFIRDAVNATPHLKGAQNVDARPFVNNGFLKVYYLTIQGVPPKDANLIAFVWPQINTQVLEFMTWAAKKDTINGIMSFTDHACIVKEYKLKGGAA